MKAINVDTNFFTRTTYCPYWKDGKEFHGKMKSTYKVGDLVYNKEENNVGVVLGYIDEQCQDLRTDMNGMQCYDQIEIYDPAKHTTAFMAPILRHVLGLDNVTAKTADLLNFGTWLSENNFTRNSYGIWSSNVHSFRAMTDESLMEMYRNNPDELKEYKQKLGEELIQDHEKSHGR